MEGERRKKTPSFGPPWVTAAHGNLRVSLGRRRRREVGRRRCHPRLIQIAAGWTDGRTREIGRRQRETEMRLKRPNNAAFLVEEDYSKKPEASGQATGVYDPRRRAEGLATLAVHGFWSKSRCFAS